MTHFPVRKFPNAGNSSFLGTDSSVAIVIYICYSCRQPVGIIRNQGRTRTRRKSGHEKNPDTARTVCLYMGQRCEKREILSGVRLNMHFLQFWFSEHSVHRRIIMTTRTRTPSAKGQHRRRYAPLTIRAVHIQAKGALYLCHSRFQSV
jgi:hypothetical protein